MSPRICMSCGKLIGEKGDADSRNPNICASCSSLSDEMPESGMSSLPDFDSKTLVKVDFRLVTAEPVKAFAHG
jgi:hypothetical protein